MRFLLLTFPTVALPAAVLLEERASCTCSKKLTALSAELKTIHHAQQPTLQRSLWTHWLYGLSL
jgi:hypothetical protein